MLNDREAKADLGYVERDSSVRPDGREILVGKDWKKRKQELWERCGKRCENVKWSTYLGKMDRCRYTFAEMDEMHPHHRVKRSRQRDDRLENLIALCWHCHRTEHPEKFLLHFKGV